MIIVSPSILSADFANLSSELQVMKNAGAPWAHVDVMDGHFVPNISIGVPVVASLRKATDLFLDVHLMIDTPIKYVDQFIASGADMVVIHLESDTPEMIHKTLSRIHELGCKAGLTIKRTVSPEVVRSGNEEVKKVSFEDCIVAHPSGIAKLDPTQVDLSSLVNARK